MSGFDPNHPGVWAGAAVILTALVKAFQVGRRLDRIDQRLQDHVTKEDTKMDKLSADVAFMRGLLEGKPGGH